MAAKRRSTLGTVLLLLVGVSSACGGQTADDDASGGASGTGGAAPSTGGSSADADGGTGGSDPETGGASTGGTGASDAGGTDGGAGGFPSLCDCDAAPLLVCGVDGATYDAACGESCVPVEIACTGLCPCPEDEGCGCVVEGLEGCDGEMRRWACFESHHDATEARELGCEGLPTGIERYCCPESVTGDAFCPE